MKDIELECMPNWRYCRVKAGEKRPYPANWQRTPLTLAQVDSDSIGLMLGPDSAGVVALDFDGPSAWSFYDSTFPGVVLPNTITWASGRTGRCQMAFAVDSESWPLLKTLKITHTKNSLIADGEGFEFRWAGGQSVLPPSQHPDTGLPYVWLQAPSQTDLAELPEAILDWWILTANPVIPVSTAEFDPLTDDAVIELALKLKNLYPTLDYDTWIRVTWAFCHEIGNARGIALMQQVYPEKTAGEYLKLVGARATGRRVTIGTVKKMIRDRTPTTTIELLGQMNHERQQLRRKIKNG